MFVNRTHQSLPGDGSFFPPSIDSAVLPGLKLPKRCLDKATRFFYSQQPQPH